MNYVTLFIPPIEPRNARNLFFKDALIIALLPPLFIDPLPPFKGMRWHANKLSKTRAKKTAARTPIIE